MIKTRGFAALTLACGLLSASFPVFVEKVDAQSASSTASFGATVPQACALLTAFPARSYTPTSDAVGAGGIKRLSRTATARFDCNSDTVNVSTVTTLNQPVPVNATNIVGSHVLVVDNTSAGLDGIITRTGSSAAAVAAIATLAAGDGSNNANSTPTDDNGNGDIDITVRSTWTSTGEDLLRGTYSANVVVTVAAN